MSTDTWDPKQYERFKAERTLPFRDLAAMIEPSRTSPSLVDLGCGTGELTAELHRQLDAATTVGIDNSTAMLDEAAAFAGPDVRFEPGDIAGFFVPDGFDVVFSNAALQWVPDHPSVLARWAASVRPGGQLAVQVPANSDHPSHLVSAEVAAEEPFLSAFSGSPPPDPVLGVLPPADYATLLHDLGFERQSVRLQVYGHVLPSTADVVEWTKGTSLTRFKAGLPGDLFDQFVDRYRSRLIQVLGDHHPYFYPFKRVLFWARKPG